MLHFFNQIGLKESNTSCLLTKRRSDFAMPDGHFDIKYIIVLLVIQYFKR